MNASVKPSQDRRRGQRRPLACGRSLIHTLALAASLAVAIGLVLSGCANPALSDAQSLNQAGQYEQALARLQQASNDKPQDLELRQALAKQRETAMVALIGQVQAARSAGQLEAAKSLLKRAHDIAPDDARVAWIEADIERGPRLQRALEQAKKDLAAHALDRAEDGARRVLSEEPDNVAARQLLDRIVQARSAAQQAAQQSLKTAAKSVTLEFRDATLRNVFEALSRAANVNFVFDKDVKADTKVSLMLRDTTVDDAMALILSTQGLERKLLNGNTVLIYQNNAQKQREYQDLVTRSFYLVNADAKQVQSLIRTMTKTRDIYEDDRLNMLVVRDRPEAIRLIEQLVEQIDLPEPEVMLEVQVMEVSTKVIDKLGLNWPTSVSYGVPSTVASNSTNSSGSSSSTVTSAAVITTLHGLQSYVANPLITAQLTGSVGDNNILANPRIRARNHEKAHVQLGDKVPVFTTTANGTTGSIASSVSYLDVGLKLDIEPQIQLDQDVIMKVALEVSSVTSQVTGPDGTIAYQVGTRQANTSLRLKDGETQILAGLINDSDNKTAAGLPYLDRTPVLAPFFGVQSHDKEKTEVVLLITPHIVRNTPLPVDAGSMLASGTDALPGSSMHDLFVKHGSAALAMGNGGAGRGAPVDDGAAGEPAPELATAAAPTSPAEPVLSGPEQAFLGSGFQVTVSNPGSEPLKTDLVFDATVLAPQDRAGSGGRLSVEIAPGQSQGYSFTVRTNAPVAPTQLSLTTGTSWQVRIQAPGSGTQGGEAPGSR